MSKQPSRAGWVALVASRIRTEERMLIEAFRRRDVPVEHVDDRSIVYEAGPRGTEAPPRWRAVLNRALSATRRLEVSRLCAAAGTPVVNELETLQVCDNKIATTLALHEVGVPTPRTTVALGAEGSLEAVKDIGFPAVVKPVNGSWGRGVAKITDIDAAEAVFDLRDQMQSPAQKLGYAQEFLPGRDLRVLVVGDTAVAAMSRESEHWIRNTARGARPLACELDAELADLAERSAEAVGGGVLGVDLLETETGERLVIEVNGAAEFHGLAEAHPDVPIADTIVDHILEGEHG